MPNQHITPKGSTWQVKGAGNTKATKIFNTQKEAIEYGKSIAQNQGVELIVHRPNGQIRDKDSYGNDPCPTVDTKF